MGRRETSRLRQLLRQAGQEHQRQVEFLLGESEPLIRGTFGTRARRCGSPACRCNEGQLHESKYLSASDGGTTRQVHVPAADEVKVAAGVEAYRRFHHGRARLAELASTQLELVDALGRCLLAPYPPDNPLPPPQRRGRPPGRPRSSKRQGR